MTSTGDGPVVSPMVEKAAAGQAAVGLRAAYLGGSGEEKGERGKGKL